MLLCGTGMGMSMIANKVPGIRAAVVENAEAAANSRSVNDSNVLSMGGEESSKTKKAGLTRWVSQNTNLYYCVVFPLIYISIAMVTAGEAAKAIVDAWLGTDFKGPSPANKGEGWNDDVKGFLTQSLPDIAKLEKEQIEKAAYQVPCPICVMTSEESYKPVESIQGATWIEVRKNPTRAYVRFPAGECLSPSSLCPFLLG